MKRLLTCVLFLAGCAGGLVPGASDNAPPPSTSSFTRPETSAPPAVVPIDCSDELVAFLEELEELDSRLTVGLNFSAYSGFVGDAQVAYDRIDFEELNATCIEQVGIPAEDAFNAYVDAYNTWNDCIGDIDCDNDSITPSLQAEWADATELLEEARAALDR